MTSPRSKIWWFKLSAVATIAALFYNSWPLGFWLNPHAMRGLASNLEALHQPYNWLFVLMDIFCGLLCCLLAWWLRWTPRVTHRIGYFVVIGLAGFGVFTLLDAVLPLDCVSSAVQQCSDMYSDPYYVIHGIVSVGSIVFLTLSIFSVWWLLVRQFRSHWLVRSYVHGVVVAWLGFGVLTAWLVINSYESTVAQRIFISLCSLWTASVPSLLFIAYRRRRLSLAPVVVRGKQSRVS